jgi:hypothetical protein
MPVDDLTILSEIQRVTLENAGDNGATWPSLMWTQAEVVGYLTQRQNRLLVETGILWTVAEVPVVVGQADQPNPVDWIASLFVAYKRAAGTYVELPRMDEQEMDLASPSWPGTTSAVPVGYTETDGPTATVQVLPIPTEVGSALERFYVALGQAFTAAGVLFKVPDEFVATVKYGCLAEMFGKVGPAHNPLLMAACEERWTEGVELGKVLAQEGWMAQ